MLSRLLLMIQAAVLDGEFFGFLSPFNDCGVSPEVGICGGDVADALVVAVVIVTIDEDTDLAFQITWQEVVFQQNPVLQRLMPALDFALGLGMVGCAADVIDTLTLEPGRKITGDVGRTVVAQQPGFVKDLCAVAP